MARLKIQPRNTLDNHRRKFPPSPTTPHHFYHYSPIHHSREFSTSRFSAFLKNPRSLSAWKHIQLNGHRRTGIDDDEFAVGGDRGFCSSGYNFVRVYILGICFFVLLFTMFFLILWGASKSYAHKIAVKVRWYRFSISLVNLTLSDTPL